MKHILFELLICNVTRDDFVVAYQSEDRNEVIDMLFDLFILL